MVALAMPYSRMARLLYFREIFEHGATLLFYMFLSICHKLTLIWARLASGSRAQRSQPISTLKMNQCSLPSPIWTRATSVSTRKGRSAFSTLRRWDYCQNLSPATVYHAFGEFRPWGCRALG